MLLSGDSCQSDPTTPLPNEREISIKLHPDISHVDDKVSEELQWCLSNNLKCTTMRLVIIRVNMRVLLLFHWNLYLHMNILFAGHFNGDALWSISRPWYDPYTRDGGGRLLQWKCCTCTWWVLPHLDPGFWPYLREFGMRWNTVGDIRKIDILLLPLTYLLWNEFSCYFKEKNWNKISYWGTNKD